MSRSTINGIYISPPSTDSVCQPPPFSKAETTASSDHLQKLYLDAVAEIMRLRSDVKSRDEKERGRSSVAIKQMEESLNLRKQYQEVVKQLQARDAAAQTEIRNLRKKIEDQHATQDENEQNVQELKKRLAEMRERVAATDLEMSYIIREKMHLQFKVETLEIALRFPMASSVAPIEKAPSIDLAESQRNNLLLEESLKETKSAVTKLQTEVSTLRAVPPVPVPPPAPKKVSTKSFPVPRRMRLTI